MRNTPTAYLLALATFFGFAGIHRFYLGKPVTAIIWLLTWGLGGLGTIYDLLTLPTQVDEANRRFLPPAQRIQLMLGPPVAAPAPAPAKVRPKDPKLDLELRTLKLARRQGGRLTTVAAAAELGVSVKDAEKQLDALAGSGHANIEVNDDGVIYYDFPALRV